MSGTISGIADGTKLRNSFRRSKPAPVTEDTLKTGATRHEAILSAAKTKFNLKVIVWGEKQFVRFKPKIFQILKYLCYL
jgi:hypothetical protein